jgi:rhomboid family GlyGly-CTERM serine protease
MRTSAPLPWFTLLLVGSMLAIFLLNGPHGELSAWAYQRSAIVDGELWRLLTGHLVHYSARHLVFNLLAFAVLAILTENQLGHAGFARLCVAIAAFIGVGLLLFVPGMEFYAGISGINYGLLAYLGLQQITRLARTGSLPAIACFASTGAVLAILLWQQARAGSSPFTGEIAGVRVAWQAHLAGILAAGLFAAQRYNRLRFPRARG